MPGLLKVFSLGTQTSRKIFIQGMNSFGKIELNEYFSAWNESRFLLIDGSRSVNFLVTKFCHFTFSTSGPNSLKRAYAGAAWLTTCQRCRRWSDLNHIPWRILPSYVKITSPAMLCKNHELEIKRWGEGEVMRVQLEGIEKWLKYFQVSTVTEISLWDRSSSSSKLRQNANNFSSVSSEWSTLKTWHKGNSELCLYSLVIVLYKVFVFSWVDTIVL